MVAVKISEADNENDDWEWIEYQNNMADPMTWHVLFFL